MGAEDEDGFIFEINISDCGQKKVSKLQDIPAVVLTMLGYSIGWDLMMKPQNIQQQINDLVVPLLNDSKNSMSMEARYETMVLYTLGIPNTAAHVYHLFINNQI